MSFETDLVIGLAELLHTAGIGRWIPPGPPGTFAPADTAITLDSLPSSPDRSIALSLYPVEDDGIGTDSTVGAQLRIRGRPGNRFDDKETADDAFNALHGLRSATINGIPIIHIWRQSGAILGTDGNNRAERTSNFYIQLTRTSEHRTD